MRPVVGLCSDSFLPDALTVHWEPDPDFDSLAAVSTEDLTVKGSFIMGSQKVAGCNATTSHPLVCHWYKPGSPYLY